MSRAIGSFLVEAIMDKKFSKALSDIKKRYDERQCGISFKADDYDESLHPRDENGRFTNGTGGSGSSERKVVSGTKAAKDSKLSPIWSKGAQKAYDKIRASEPKITSDVHSIASKLGNSLSGLEYSVKTGSSISDKLSRMKEDADQNGYEFDEEYAVSNDMWDVVRYTQITDHDRIVETTNETVKALEEAGYTVLEVTNKYLKKDTPYKGVHIYAQDKDGQVFEMQVHSKESLDVKNKTHRMYEEARHVDTPPERKRELNQQMSRIVNSLPDSKGIADLKDYKYP